MIEDDIFLRKLYRDQLTREGFEFVEATNGIEGLNKARSERPDLILLDLMLPRKNGFDVLEDLKGDKSTRDIPTLVLSNLGQESDIQEAMNLGAEAYLVKTDVRMSEAVEKIKQILSKK